VRDLVLGFGPDNFSHHLTPGFREELHRFSECLQWALVYTRISTGYQGVQRVYWFGAVQGSAER